MTDSEVIKIDCRNSSHPAADDFCEVELRVMGLKRFVAFDRERTQALSPGAHLRVEMFRSGPTGGVFDGRFVIERGSPQEAAHMLKLASAVIGVLGLIAALYLWMRKK